MDSPSRMDRFPVLSIHCSRIHLITHKINTERVYVELFLQKYSNWWGKSQTSTSARFTCIPTRPCTTLLLLLVPPLRLVPLLRSRAALLLGCAEAQKLDAGSPTGVAESALHAVEVSLQIFITGTTGVRLRDLGIQIGKHLCCVGCDVARERLVHKLNLQRGLRSASVSMSPNAK